MMNKTNILVFGDSIVYGIGDYELGGWVNRLRLKLERTPLIYDIYNLGIPDDTSKDILKRFKKELKSRYYQGELVIIFGVGGNDSSQTNISTKQFEKNITKLIRYAKRKTNKIAFVGLSGVIDSAIEGRLGKVAFLSKDKFSKFNKSIKKICEKEQIKYIPLKQKIGLSDPVHPDSDGYEYISEKVYNYIRKEV